jgi:hypothetical protein
VGLILEQANALVGMPRIGIYSVDSAELTKPPSDREYVQRGVYDPANRSWSESTDSRVECLLPETESEYSVEEIQDTVETTTTHVYLEEEVPGIVKQPSSVGRFRSVSD